MLQCKNNHFLSSMPDVSFITSSNATFAPASKNNFAQAAPIPLAAPVITAVLFIKFIDQFRAYMNVDSLVCFYLYFNTIVCNRNIVYTKKFIFQFVNKRKIIFRNELSCINVSKSFFAKQIRGNINNFFKWLMHTGSSKFNSAIFYFIFFPMLP